MDPHLLHLLWLVAGVMGVPAPSRIPKVYNALITSNQNLEPSKAYPVYQPVLHDAFAFPYQPAVFYGDLPVSNSLQPVASLPPKDQNPTQEPAPSADSASEKTAISTETPPSPEEPKEPENDSKPTPAPPLPPNTQSPIPLNEYGLPSQVLPLGRFNPAYDGFTQLGPFTYTYPGFRFYDPYDPFNINPYANLPLLYRSVPNLLSPPLPVDKQTPPSAPAEQKSDSASPPPEPSDLNVLNYSSKDPAIPNVPPPPLPQGGLKSDKSE